MSPAKNVTEGVKTAIIKAVEAKTPYSTISKQFGVSKSTIAYIMKLFRETGDVLRRSVSGRLRKTTKKEDRMLIRLSKADPRKNAVELNTEMRNKYSVEECYCHKTTSWTPPSKEAVHKTEEPEGPNSICNGTSPLDNQAVVSCGLERRIKI